MYKFFLLILILPMSLISNLPGSPSPGQYSLSSSSERHILNFDFDWKFTKSDPENAQDINFIDSNWRTPL